MPAVILLDALVRVPGVFEVPAAGVELHEPHAALDQPPGDQAVAAELVGRLLADAVHVERRCVFLRQVDRLGRLGLHAEGQFVALMRAASSAPPGRASRCCWFSSASRSSCSRCAGLVDVRGPAQVENRVADRAEQRALISGRHEAARPVRLAADRPAALVENDDVAGQVLVPVPRPYTAQLPSDGRPMNVLPVFIATRAEPWAWLSVWHERIDGQLVGVLADLAGNSRRSSARSRRRAGTARNAGVRKPILRPPELMNFLSAGSGWPAYFSSSGL